MGRWYLRQLGQVAPAESQRFFGWADVAMSGEATARFPPGADGGHRAVDAGEGGSALVLYVNPDVRRLALLVETARARLAELETAYTLEKAKVDALQATLFKRLGEHYRKRDRLRLLVGYRRKFLEALLARRRGGRGAGARGIPAGGRADHAGLRGSRDGDGGEARAIARGGR